MATLACCANGNLTSASTWALVDSTSFLNSEASNTALTTSVQRSSTFTPGAITIDGIAVRLASRAASPSGTITVRLDQGTTAVTGTSVTIDVADLPTSNVSPVEGGWIFFKFAAPVTLAAATAYSVAAFTSGSSQVSLARNATSANFSRYLRTTTTQAPVAGDDMMIGGEFTGSGAMTTRTVSMDSTATTDYGANANSNATPSLSISKGGTLSYLNAASTNYIFRVSGRIVVYNGGTFNIGTSGAPIPRSSTAILELDSSTALGSGLVVKAGGSFSSCGESRTSGKNTWIARLTADAAANATSLSVDTDTGWLDNDEIVIATGTRTGSQSERGTLNGAAGASTLTVDGFAGTGGGLANAHPNNSLFNCEVFLLSRNVEIRSTSNANRAYLQCTGGQVYAAWTRFTYMGNSSQYGVEINTSSYAVDISYLSFDRSNIVLGGAGSTTTATASYLCAWDAGDLPNSFLIAFGASNSDNTNVTATGAITVRSSGNSSGLMIQSSGLQGSFTDMTAIGGVTTALEVSGVSTGTFNGLMGRAASTTGVKITSANAGAGASISNVKGLRTGGTGVALTLYACYQPLVNVWGVGNQSQGLSVDGNAMIKNLVLGGESSYSCFYGMLPGASSTLQVDGGTCGSAGGWSNCSLGMVYGSLGSAAQVTLNDFSYGESAPLVSTIQDNMYGTAFLALMDEQGVAGAFSRHTGGGKLERDATTYYSSAPSEKLTPRNDAAGVKQNYRLKSQVRQVLVQSGETPTISAYVMKSASYNGAQPRLILLPNAQLGYDFTVLDTMAGGTGSWEQLSGTLGAAAADGVVEVYVDCNGTAGYINVDEWGVT